jgi:hypothetical protein
MPGSLRRVPPIPSRHGRRCRRPDEDHRRHQCVFKPASAPAPDESTPGTAHNRRSGPADRCHTGRDQALHPRAAELRHASRKTARPRDRKYRSVAGGQSARRPRSPSIGGSCIPLPRVLRTVRRNTVHQPGRTVPVMSVRAALTQGRSPLRVLTADTALLPGCPAAVRFLPACPGGGGPKTASHGRA